MPEDEPAQPAQPAKQRYYTRARVMRRLLLVFGMYIGLCAAIAWVSVRAQRGGIPARPPVNNIAFENVSIYSADGTRLSGWYIPPTHKAKAVIILCHGVDGTRMGMLEPAMMLHEHGYATLLFDFRARGNSDGDHSTLGWKETDDLLAAIQFVKKRKDLQGVPIGVLGHSMGGAVALMAAARSADVVAVVAESAFAQLDHAVHNHFRNVFGWTCPIFEFTSRWMGQKIIGRNCADISPVKMIAAIAPRSVFLIQDADDTLCPQSEARDLFQACGDPKLLWTVPHAGHIQAIQLQREEFEKRVVGFFDRYLHI